MTAATMKVGPEDFRRGWFGTMADRIDRTLGDLSVGEKTYGMIALLVIVTGFLLVMSIQSVRLATIYRHLQAASSAEAINIGRVNGLIYAIVMESRGIYMSTDRVEVKQFGDALLRRNRELAGVMAAWEATAHDDDGELFSAFKQRILQFIKLRNELARRGVEISPAAAREWGEANRDLRTQLNADLEALEKIYAERALVATELGDKGRYAAWYLFALGLCCFMLAALAIVVMRRFVIKPLRDITQATALVTAGSIGCDIPYVARADEIGCLARAVKEFRNTLGRNLELRQLEQGTAQQRDAARDERDKFSEKYHEAKWLLYAAIKNVPQGIIMLDPKATVLAINDQYRKMYRLPAAITAGSTMEEILQHRVASRLFTGDVDKYLADIVERIGSRRPTSVEVVLRDGRVIDIQEQAADGGGWVAIHNDVTAQRQKQRILERTERLLAAVVENIPEGIIAKDGRSLRYVYLNKAAEAMMGQSRAEVVGKTARELFSPETAELIERRDRQLIAQKQQLEPLVDTIDNPVRGRRTIAARRLQVGGPDEDSHLLVCMFEDLTEPKETSRAVRG